MVEVFKTNLKSQEQAGAVLDEIRKVFGDYVVNFDLDDCDKILRVKSEVELIQNDLLICLLKDLGYEVEVLPDDPTSTEPALAIMKEQASLNH